MNSELYEHLLFNSDIVNFVLKNDGGGEMGMRVGLQKNIFFLLRGCFNCGRVRCGGFGQKALFRTG